MRKRKLENDKIKWVKKALRGYYSYCPENFRTLEISDDFKKGLNGVSTNSGVYVVLAKGIDEDFNVVYIGSSGKLKHKNGIGVISTRNGGIRSRLVNGRVKVKSEIDQKSVKDNRLNKWKRKMTKSHFTQLTIYWLDTVFVGVDSDHSKIPLYVEASLFQRYFEDFKSLPEWNVSF